MADGMTNSGHPPSETKAKYEWADSLVGTVWRKGNAMREVTRVFDLRESGSMVVYSVYWKPPGGKERAKPTWCSTWESWISNAEKVDE